MKFRNILIITSILASYFLSFLLYKSSSISKWLDALFLVGLLLLIISAIMTLIEAQFFIAFIKSFKHFFSRVNKKEQVIREIEKRQNYTTVVYQKKFPSRKLFFVIGILFCFASLLVSSIIYYFGR
jgi:membrane-bound ClpP family serine protease